MQDSKDKDAATELKAPNDTPTLHCFLKNRRAVELFVKTLEKISEIAKNVTIRAADDALRIQAMDNSHVCIIDVIFDKDEFFQLYDLDEAFFFCLPLENVLKTLKSLKSHSVVGFQVTRDKISFASRSFDMMGKGKGKTNKSGGAKTKSKKSDRPNPQTLSEWNLLDIKEDLIEIQPRDPTVQFVTTATEVYERLNFANASQGDSIEISVEEARPEESENENEEKDDGAPLPIVSFSAKGLMGSNKTSLGGNTRVLIAPKNSKFCQGFGYKYLKMACHPKVAENMTWTLIEEWAMSAMCKLTVPPHVENGETDDGVVAAAAAAKKRKSATNGGGPKGAKKSKRGTEEEPPKEPGIHENKTDDDNTDENEDEIDDSKTKSSLIFYVAPKSKPETEE